MSSVNRPNAELPEGTYVEQVRSLFLTVPPTIIMSIAFVGVGIFIQQQTTDRAVGMLLVAGAIASLARVAVALGCRRHAADESLGSAQAARLERIFAASYFTFAGILGVFGARAFLVTAPDARMLLTTLLVGYGAGVAAGLALRPWIAIPSMLIAIVPTILIAGAMPDAATRAVAVLMAALLAGGIGSLLGRYRAETRKIAMRRMFATLARHDHLTHLPNRLSLAEKFEGLDARSGNGGEIVVHCLDLDRFKPVNDRYGHPTGDALLQAVADRLAGLLRRSDFAARIGGDEFVVVQSGIGHRGEADMLARRICRAISEPYDLGGHSITIGVSVGYALSSACGPDLDRLTACADDALYQIKRAGGGILAYGGPAGDREQRAVRERERA